MRSLPVNGHLQQSQPTVTTPPLPVALQAPLQHHNHHSTNLRRRTFFLNNNYHHTNHSRRRAFFLHSHYSHHHNHGHHHNHSRRPSHQYHNLELYGAVLCLARDKMLAKFWNHNPPLEECAGILGTNNHLHAETVVHAMWGSNEWCDTIGRIAGRGRC